MAKRGRKPRPPELKVVRGTRKDRINGDAPDMLKGSPIRPNHLAGEAAAEWDRMVEILDQMGVLSQADGAALALYCVAYARWLEAREALENDGLTVKTPKGGEKTHPAATIAAAAEIQMARLLAEFGATPSSRGRVHVLRRQDRKDALADFLAKKRG